MFTTICCVVFASALPSFACPPRCSPIDDIEAFLLSQRLAVDRVRITMEAVTMLNRSFTVHPNRVEHVFPLLTIKLTRYDWPLYSSPVLVAEFVFTFTVHNLTIIIPSGGGSPTVIGSNIYPWNGMRQMLGSACGFWFNCGFTDDNLAGIVHALLNSGKFGEVCENA